MDIRLFLPVLVLSTTVLGLVLDLKDNHRCCEIARSSAFESVSIHDVLTVGSAVDDVERRTRAASSDETLVAARSLLTPVGIEWQPHDARITIDTNAPPE